MRVRTGLIAAALALSASPLAAQEPGTFELGLFGQFSWFDDHTTLTDLPAPGVGGFLGLFVLPNLAVEAGTSYTWTHEDTRLEPRATWMPLRARLVYNVPLTDDFYPLLGVGFVRNQYSDAFEADDNGLTGLVGMKAYLSDRTAFRADLNLDYMQSPFNDGVVHDNATISDHMNWTWTAGFSWDMGAGRAKDSDGDGVRDRDDACANTPFNVAVDARGCRLDADSDGVYDEDDQCANTPSGARVDATGCRVDSDGDGVYDEDDRCANTPDGVDVDANGCAVDTDSDGVPDHQDRCDNTPAGASVDANGCRRDADNDGVFDEDDRCRDTARGTEVDEVGCPVLFADDETTVLVLEGVTFETNSADLTSGAQNILDRVAESLVGNPDIRVRVNGHTDATGAHGYNVTLSQSRAESVRAYLVTQGVAQSRMEAQGFGPDQPVASNATNDGRQQNRRVELERIN